VSEERRCPHCGALVAADAQWCNQCLEPLPDPQDAEARSPSDPGSPPPGPSAESPGASPPDDPAAAAPAYWPCGACGNRNPIEVMECAVCGTPFAKLMRGEAERGPVDPGAALRRSLVFPGLGHRLAGRGMDGLARGVLFAIAVVMALLSGTGGTKTPATTLTLVVFVALALVVYAGSAIEARRVASGRGLLVSSRFLLWTLVGVVLGSVALLGLSVFTSLRR